KDKGRRIECRLLVRHRDNDLDLFVRLKLRRQEVDESPLTARSPCHVTRRIRHGFLTGFRVVGLTHSVSVLAAASLTALVLNRVAQNSLDPKEPLILSLPHHDPG